MNERTTLRGPTTEGRALAIRGSVGHRVYPFAKRAFDLSVVIVAAPLWIALYASIAALILAFEGRPIHFRHRRVGKHGREFSLLKFRSMRPDADAELAALLARRSDLKEEFARFSKLRSDPRVTGLGRFLRRFSLDELPQLFHVLRGTMSLVGPRPLTRTEIDECYGEGARELLSAAPGVTGLWQISGRSTLSLETRAQLDLRYIRERSFRRDLAIFLETIPTVVRGSEVA